MTEDGSAQPDMPQCSAPHIIQWFFEVGPATGEYPVTFSEIRDWSFCTGITLQPWDARMIRTLSKQYLNECSRARDEKCLPPWEDDAAIKVASNMAADSLKNSIRALAQL